MEMCRRRRPHLHAMVQFRKAVDLPSRDFAFRGISPNARPSWVDYCRQGLGKRNPQRSLDRGFFYVFANKIGTCIDSGGHLCVRGNYGPAWGDWPYLYEASGEWAETLWRRYQLAHAHARAYIIKCRGRAPARLRNVEVGMQGEEELMDAEAEEALSKLMGEIAEGRGFIVWYQTPTSGKPTRPIFFDLFAISLHPDPIFSDFRPQNGSNIA